MDSLATLTVFLRKTIVKPSSADYAANIHARDKQPTIAFTSIAVMDKLKESE